MHGSIIKSLAWPETVEAIGFCTHKPCIAVAWLGAVQPTGEHHWTSYRPTPPKLIMTHQKLSRYHKLYRGQPFTSTTCQHAFLGTIILGRKYAHFSSGRKIVKHIQKGISCMHVAK